MCSHEDGTAGQVESPATSLYAGMNKKKRMSCFSFPKVTEDDFKMNQGKIQNNFFSWRTQSLDNVMVSWKEVNLTENRIVSIQPFLSWLF